MSTGFRRSAWVPMDCDLRRLNMPSPLIQRLWFEGADSIADLTTWSVADLDSLRHVGAVRVEQVVEALEELGLTLADWKEST